jgi:23S rRNA (adenine-N6)-dimethyltransferase
VSARGRTPRDDRRRTHGQNFLADPSVVQRFLARAELHPDDFVVEFGARTGALTVPLARSGARVLAVERDPVWVRRLRARLDAEGLSNRVRVVHGDLRHVPLPDRPYRVVSSPPFGFTTALMARLFDDPRTGRSAPTC